MNEHSYSLDYVYSHRARVGALVNPVADPLSGEPALKLTPARATPMAMAWYSFLLVRGEPQPPRMHGIDYWSRIRGKVHWRVEPAGFESQFKWSPWAKSMLDLITPNSGWLE